ncbi:MAG: tRNA epoxyqueuosine(34) reductase QueG [Clostridiaceae bacterium]|nr:tRNA epoxyqueuosine(34) reductase QueG [Clostridiaceae bacterium]
MNENNKVKIIKYCKDLGLDTLGFTKCRKFHELEEMFQLRKVNGLENIFEENDINKRINPNLYMKEGKTIISIAFPYLYDKRFNEGVNFSKYTHGLDYHSIVQLYLMKICDYIEKLGGKAISFVDSNALPERHIAALCGVGFIGKNQMLITSKYGSYVFLGEIITDLTLEESSKMEEDCGNCTACLSKCPSSSIHKGGCNPNECLSFLTQKKDLEDDELLKLKGRIFGCDSCQSSCPKNINIDFSKVKEFKPLVFMEKVNIEEIIFMNNSVFNEKYKKTSCGWRGKNLLQRNAIINVLLSNNMVGYDWNEIKSTYVKKYYNRLLYLIKL